MSKSRSSSLHAAFLSGLLSQTPSASSIAAFCGVSTSSIAAALTTHSFAAEAHLRERAATASPNTYLVFDYTQTFHSGTEMQGISSAYSSTHKGSRLGHRYASVALVGHQKIPVPISLTYAVGKELATEVYTYLTPSTQLIQTVESFKKMGIQFSGTLVDAEFGSKEVVNHFVKQSDSLLTRMRNTSRITWNGVEMNLKALAKNFPRSACHLYEDLDWRAKRVAVQFDGNTVDIIIVWRNVNGFWGVFFLLSTFPQSKSAGELVKAWKARWGIEVIHRFLKQKLSFGKCQYKDIRAHQNWADLVVDAFHLIVQVRRKHPNLSWKAAQVQAAA